MGFWGFGVTTVVVVFVTGVGVVVDVVLVTGFGATITGAGGGTGVGADVTKLPDKGGAADGVQVDPFHVYQEPVLASCP